MQSNGHRQDAKQITLEIVEAAAKVAGIALERPAIQKIVESLNRNNSSPIAAIRLMNLPTSLSAIL